MQIIYQNLQSFQPPALKLIHFKFYSNSSFHGRREAVRVGLPPQTTGGIRPPLIQSGNLVNVSPRYHITSSGDSVHPLIIFTTIKVFSHSVGAVLSHGRKKGSNKKEGRRFKELSIPLPQPSLLLSLGSPFSQFWIRSQDRV